MAIALYGVEPWLIERGIPPYYASSLCLYLPLGLLGALALSLSRREATGRLAARLRLFPLSLGDLPWLLGLCAAMIVPFAAIDAALKPAFEAIPWIMPAYVPEALRAGPIDWVASAGAPLRGNWPLAMAACAFFALNVAGEELWWRGYVLPRQEATMGKRAWIAHGVLWALFHAPKYWAIPALLPGALAAAFVAYRRKSTTCALAAHALANGIGLVSLLASIAA
jgi:membrane protease YdiL (CAAX protease family)